ncbi:hypothetical protein BV20DRAFT_1052063 [Pilatotrama ljubarskyi]|nr:hypothetical protein BV20DRAFT_1052063 [Pilatotrama ljubarskyi]
MRWSLSSVSFICLFMIEAASTLVAVAGTLAEPEAPGAATSVTRAELLHWLATTGAEVNWIGDPINPLAGPSEDSPDASVTVVWCNTQTGNDCLNPCYAYSGAGSVCITGPDIACLSSTNDDVTFCTSNSCGSNCPRFGDCAVPLNHNFCLTSNANAISIPAAA